MRMRKWPARAWGWARFSIVGHIREICLSEVMLGTCGPLKQEEIMWRAIAKVPTRRGGQGGRQSSFSHSRGHALTFPNERRYRNKPPGVVSSICGERASLHAVLQVARIKVPPGEDESFVIEGEANPAATRSRRCSRHNEDVANVWDRSLAAPRTCVPQVTRSRSRATASRAVISVLLVKFDSGALRMRWIR